MATSGSFYSSFGTNSAYRIVLEWKINSADIANNKSNVTITAYLQSTGSSYTINSSATKNGSMTINGTTYSFTFSASLSGSQKKQIYTKTVDIYHNSDGTKSFSMSVTAAIAITFSSGYVASVSTSGTGTLDDIPRTSSFTLNTTNATLGSTAVTVTISRASTSFTHKVWVVFGSISSTVTSSAGTSASWTPPLSLASQIPNSTTGTATVYVQTLNGSTAIGTASKTITYTVPSSVIPTITSLSANVVAAGAATSYGYIQGKSKCQLVINDAAGSYGSTIKSYKITGNGGTWTTSSTTTGVLNSAGTFTYTATVTDSRGRTSAAKTVSITVQSYTTPKITNYNAIRCTSDGIASDAGTYLKVFAQYSYDTLGDKNFLTNQISYRPIGTADWSDGGTVASGNSVVFGGGNISTANSYDVRLMITDAFGSVSKILTVAPEFVTMDFLAGGTGISIGKAATTSNLFESNLPAQFNEKVTLRKGSTVSRCTANSGTAGFIKIATITISVEYASQPIIISLLQRTRPSGSTLSIQFTNSNSTDPDVASFHKIGNVEAYLHRSGTGVWDLYVTKSEGYDDIEITDFKIGEYMRSKVTVTFVDEFSASLPSDVYSASYSAVRSGSSWNGHPVCVETNGVSEIGKYLDFHESGTADVDYSGRITVEASNFLFTQHLVPSANNAKNLGSTSNRWATVYAVNAFNTSDIQYKENITPINESNAKTMSLRRTINEEDANTDEITLSDMRDFIRDDCDLFKYNYKNQENEEIGFIAQDIVNTKVGRTLVVGEENVDGGYSYSTGTYMGIIVGALKEEIITRDAEIESLQETILALEERLLKLEESLNNETEEYSNDSDDEIDNG